MDPAWVAALGKAAGGLGFPGLAVLAIAGLCVALRTIWGSYQTTLKESRAEIKARDSLIFDQESEHGRLLVRFEEAMNKLRDSEAARQAAEARAQTAEGRLREAEDEWRQDRRRRRGD